MTTRAAIIDDAHADVAVDIHADGGPASGRGFTVLEPEPDGPNNGVITSSEDFATIMRNAFEAGTPMPVSNYDGVDGLQPRDDLAGLNLTTVPKVLVECANMRNATDASLLVTAIVPATGGGRDGRSHHRIPDRALGPDSLTSCRLTESGVRPWDSAPARTLEEPNTLEHDGRATRAAGGSRASAGDDHGPPTRSPG